jgi:hypothetical protein
VSLTDIALMEQRKGARGRRVKSRLGSTTASHASLPQIPENVEITPLHARTERSDSLRERVSLCQQGVNRLAEVQELEVWACLPAIAFVDYIHTYTETTVLCASGMFTNSQHALFSFPLDKVTMNVVYHTGSRDRMCALGSLFSRFTTQTKQFIVHHSADSLAAKYSILSAD